MQEVTVNPNFLDLTGGGPAVTNSYGVPWSGAYVNANGDLTVDLRSDIAAESRAKIVYEYLMQFTNDPHVKDTLSFLMTREIAHFQMFAAALNTIEPNFPPGVLQGDPKFTHLYFNMSNGQSARGPWNQGDGPWPEDEEWVYIEDPIEHVSQTNGLVQQEIKGHDRSMEEVERANHALSKQRSQVVQGAVPQNNLQWSSYDGGTRRGAAFR